MAMSVRQDTASAGFLADLFCHQLAGETAYYIFIDDFHLLTDGRVADFLCLLANRMTSNVHLIAASRDPFPFRRCGCASGAEASSAQCG